MECLFDIAGTIDPLAGKRMLAMGSKRKSVASESEDRCVSKIHKVWYLYWYLENGMLMVVESLSKIRLDKVRSASYLVT